jgi:hypothetical protein
MKCVGIELGRGCYNLSLLLLMLMRKTKRSTHSRLATQTDVFFNVLLFAIVNHVSVKIIHRLPLE